MLNMILVIVFHMDAAWAVSMISQMISCVLVLGCLVRSEGYPPVLFETADPKVFT